MQRELSLGFTGTSSIQGAHHQGQRIGVAPETVVERAYRHLSKRKIVIFCLPPKLSGLYQLWLQVNPMEVSMSRKINKSNQKNSCTCAAGKKSSNKLEWVGPLCSVVRLLIVLWPDKICLEQLKSLVDYFT